ncbi:hypothetical protein CCR75_003688 [Bremia lactucae]|uniref:Temptin Cys/Cys disulfide domain-containing protein n=1 Tax=Bremia lactucae TaxID=4779 RepID=A0A976NYL2_BRELC|nr:hypothetical protein CCR75_003688 [Bremia lactucae]
MESYLEKLPNGAKFAKELGHVGGDSSKLTDFASNFLAKSLTWDKSFCGETFPGSTMTNGEAFGDPCCMWTPGGPKTPDFAVAAFTTTPGEPTVCANAGSSESPPDEKTSASDESAGNNPTQFDPAVPDTTDSTTTESTSYGAPSPDVSTPPAPETIDPLPTSGGGCAVKGARKLRQ